MRKHVYELKWAVKRKAQFAYIVLVAPARIHGYAGKEVQILLQNVFSAGSLCLFYIKVDKLLLAYQGTC